MRGWQHEIKTLPMFCLPVKRYIDIVKCLNNYNMKNKMFILITSLIIIVVFMYGYREKLINSATFYPQPGTDIKLDNLPNHIEHRFIETSDKIKISTFYFANNERKRTILYFHGNAGNASHRIPVANQLWSLGTNVLLVDYRGYGLSEGQPSEKGIYLDAESALNYIVNDLSVPMKDIIILGRSIGSAVAIDVAQNKELAALILISPLSSGRDVANKSNIIFANVLIGNPFNSIEKIKNVRSPILIIHGEKDEVLPIEMGRTLQANAQAYCRFIEIKDAGHDDIIYRDERSFYNYIKEFLNNDLYETL